MSQLTKLNFMGLLSGISKRRGAIFGIIIFSALIAFEIFNFSTTQFALDDMLGDLTFLGLSWATILAIAFCGIDFAGIARIFTPEQGREEPVEVWYLLGAWFLAAIMNASLTWWGVSVAIQNHQTLGSAVVGQQFVTRVVPIFVALMVLTIRVLIIGTFSIAGDRLFSMAGERQYSRPSNYSRPVSSSSMSQPVRPASSMSASSVQRPPTGATLVSARSLMQQPAQNVTRPAPKPASVATEPPARAEPTYHPIGGLSASPREEYVSTRR